MPIHLDKWQEEIVRAKGHILLCTGRQVGKTTIFAIKSAEYMLKHPNCRIIVVSLTEDQAQLMIVMILTYLEQNYRKFIAKGLRKPTKTKIQLTNKSEVIARPVGNTGDAVRGFTGDVLIVDEASRMPELMWSAAKPSLLTRGGEVWMCSTPFGKHGYFYECFLNKHKRFKVWHVNSWDVIHEREISHIWSKHRREEAIRFLDEEKRDMTPLQWQQEYLGLFIDELRQFFKDETIRKLMTEKRPETIARDRPHYLGVDVGRMGEDPSTYEVLKRVGEHGYHVENQVTKKTILTQTAEQIFMMNSLYDFRKIYIDDEGIGIGVFDMLISTDATKRKTEALRNSRKLIDYKANINSLKRTAGKTRMLKVDLYMNLLKLMEQGRIHLLDDPEVFLSLKSVQYEYTTDKKGKPFLHIFGNDTHITEGLIRAAWGLKEKNINRLIYSFKP